MQLDTTSTSVYCDRIYSFIISAYLVFGGDFRRRRQTTAQKNKIHEMRCVLNNVDASVLENHPLYCMYLFKCRSHLDCVLKIRLTDSSEQDP